MSVASDEDVKRLVRELKDWSQSLADQNYPVSQVKKDYAEFPLYVIDLLEQVLAKEYSKRARVVE